jgi:hypothetical protein
MYIQIKKANNTEYVYLVEAFRCENGSIGHRTIKKLGRLDVLVKDDPNALEKLKKEIREKSATMRGAISRGEVSKLNSMASHPLIQDYYKGLPMLNYGFSVFRYIWTDMLKLEYRLNYLQNKQYSNIPYSLSDILLAKLVVESLSLDVRDSNIYFGDDLGFLGLNYTAEQVNEYHIHAQKILDEESLRMLRFVVKQLSSEYDLDFLNSGMTQMSLHFDKTLMDSFDLDEKGITINKEELVHSKVSRFNQIMSYIRMICLKIIRNKVEVKFNIKYDYAKIKTALREANLLVDYPLEENGKFLYIKANNGENVVIINNILESFDMKPLLNISDRIEVGHRLHYKLKNDKQLVPDYIYSKVTR